MNLEKLLNPRRICIVGASEKDGFGGDASRNALAHMERDRFFFVNPHRREIFGIPAYPSMEEVPLPFDLAVICTPLSTVEGLLEQAKACGASAAVVYASGYKEIGTPEGIAAQESLIRKARQLDMVVMGPNCAGFINNVAGVTPFAFVPQTSFECGTVGFASQSGQLCLSMIECSNLKFSCCISAGNAALVSMEDYMEYLVDDPHTKVVALYLEGVRDPARFAAVLEKATRKKKPVVILKTGKSAKGQAVAASHTGSLSGSDRFFDALLAKFGAIRVNDLEELIGMSQLLATLKVLPQAGGVTAVSLSGGETGICADMGSISGLDYPELSQTTREKLQALLPAYASIHNPLDITATLSYDPEKFAQVLRILEQDSHISMILLGYTLLDQISDPAIFHMTTAIEAVTKEGFSKPMAMLPFAESSRNPDICQRLEACGVPVLPATLYGFRLVSRLMEYARFDLSKIDLRLSLASRPRNPQRFSVSEHEGKAILQRYGIPVTREMLLTDPEQLEIAFGEIGFPMAMKISSPDVLHKSDCGGVVLNIETPQQAREAYFSILSCVKQAFPQAKIEGILAQEMVKGDWELLVGLNSDPQWGMSIVVGLGGIFVEVFRDTAMKLAPVSHQEALDMLHSLKSYRLLTGCRGKKPVDLDQLTELIVGVSNMAYQQRDSLMEMDINPVILSADRITAADCVIVSDQPL